MHHPNQLQSAQTDSKFRTNLAKHALMEDIFQHSLALSLKEIKYDKTLPKIPNSDPLEVKGSPDEYPISYQQNKLSSIDIF